MDDYTDEYGEIYPHHYYSMGKDYTISEQIREARELRLKREKEKEKEGLNIGDVKYVIAFILLIWIVFNISKFI